MNENNGIKRILTGKVISNKMNKSIVVSVERRVSHEKYGKVVRRTSKIHAHDEKNESNIGDIVQIAETRPISKTKAWKLVEIIQRAR